MLFPFQNCVPIENETINMHADKYSTSKNKFLV